MIKLICDKIARVIKNRKKLEEALGLQIVNRGTEVYIKGAPEDEYVAEKVIEALDFGFPYSVAISLIDELYLFEIINIKSYSHKKDFARIRARIIGKEGKTLKTLSGLTKCFFELKDNEVGIIGEAEYIKNAQYAIISLIQGSKQANVYAYLEKHQIQPVFDLGLKEVKHKNL